MKEKKIAKKGEKKNIKKSPRKLREYFKARIKKKMQIMHKLR